MSDFYVGYQAKAPAGLGNWMMRVALALTAGALLIALALVLAQAPFSDAHYEYGTYRDYVGEVLEWPAPMLLTEQGSFLLGTPGKHGASGLVRGHEGETLRVQASLIQRHEGRMLEMKPETMRFVPSPVRSTSARTSLGSFTFTGEIIDTKCFLGIMNPGSGKVHRDCAVRCISGGVPPGLLVRDASGEARVLLVRGADGRAIGHSLLGIVGERVTVYGELLRAGDSLVFQAEPGAFRRE